MGLHIHIYNNLIKFSTLKNLACKCQKHHNFWLHKMAWALILLVKPMALGFTLHINARYTNEDHIQIVIHHQWWWMVRSIKFCTTMIITKDSIQILIHQQCWWMVRSIKFCTTMIITKDSIWILIHYQCWWMVRSIKFCTIMIIIKDSIFDITFSRGALLVDPGLCNPKPTHQFHPPPTLSEPSAPT